MINLALGRPDERYANIHYYQRNLADLWLIWRKVDQMTGMLTYIITKETLLIYD